VLTNKVGNMELQCRFIIVFIMVLFPLISESKEMSFIFEGEVTSNAYSDFITDTNFAIPATVYGMIVYDTDENFGATGNNDRYDLIGIQLTLVSQTGVTMEISSNDVYVTYWNWGITTTSRVETLTSTTTPVNIAWSGPAVGSGTAEYVPDRIQVVFNQNGSTLLESPTELSGTYATNAVQIEFENFSINGNMTSLKVVDGNSLNQGNPESSSSDGGGGTFNLISLFALLIIFLVLTVKPVTISSVRLGNCGNSRKI